MIRWRKNSGRRTGPRQVYSLRLGDVPATGRRASPSRSMRMVYAGAALFIILAALIAGGAWMRYGADSASDAASRLPLALSNRQVVERIAGSAGSRHLYQLAVPDGASQLQFTAFDSDSGVDVDIYARLGAPPTTDSFDAKGEGAEGTKTILVAAPRAGTWYLLLRGARGRYAGVSLVGSYAAPGAVFKTGMHAHRLYNGGGSAEPQFRYGLVRDWDIDRLHDAVIWKRDGSIDFTLVDRVYAGHARHGAKVIKTFGTVPAWAAKRPAEPNHQYPDWPGAKSGPRNLDEYEDYVFRFVSHNRHALWAVEGWNEPYACSANEHEFTTMTPTELADVQKRIYRATRRVDPGILVLSPAQAYVCGIPVILNARTSEGEPISKFFDVFAWHAYNRSARGDAGPSYAMEIHQVRTHLDRAGLAGMPIADTEHGWLAPPKEGGRRFHAYSDAEKGRVLYETAQQGKSMGLLATVWYGYDNRLLGLPMKSAVVSDSLQRIYRDFNTPKGNGHENP